MMTVWGRINSVCTQRVLWCLEEIGKEYDLVLASSIYGPDGHVWKGVKPFGLVDTPAYLRMNPTGTVPTLRDGNITLWDSNAIVCYLALRYGRQLYRSEANFARASAWMNWCNSDFGGPIGVISKNLWRMPPEDCDSSKIREAEAAMIEKLQLVENQLAQSTYIASDFLSIGDIALAPFAQRWIHFDRAVAPTPNMRAWLSRLSASPGFKKYVQPREYHADN